MKISDDERTDAGSNAPVMQRPDAEKDCRQEEAGDWKMRWLDIFFFFISAVIFGQASSTAGVLNLLYCSPKNSQKVCTASITWADFELLNSTLKSYMPSEISPKNNKPLIIFK